MNRHAHPDAADPLALDALAPAAQVLADPRRQDQLRRLQRLVASTPAERRVEIVTRHARPAGRA